MTNIGTHNSWTYAKPLKWYMPSFIAKCQAVDISRQYQMGVRLFDLRLKKDRGYWVVAHGLVSFDINWMGDLRWLNQRGDVYVRVILEYNTKRELEIPAFQLLCSKLPDQFPDIKFTDGRCKWDWKVVYKFKDDCPPLLDKYSSTTSLFQSDSKFLRIIDDWWPWLYARLNNRKNYKAFCESNKGEYLLLDFINMIENELQ